MFTQKIKVGYYELLSLGVLCVFFLVIKEGFLGTSQMGTIVMLAFLQSLVCVTAVWLSGYLQWRIGDALLLSTVIFLLRSITYGRMSYMAFFLTVLWLGILLITKIRCKNIRSQSVECFLAYTIGIAGYALFTFLYEKIFFIIYDFLRNKYTLNQWQKAICLSILTLFIIAIISVFLSVIQLLFHRFLYQLGQLGNKYEEIASYILLLPWILIAILWIFGYMEYWFFAMTYHDEAFNETVQYILWILIVFILGMQLLYIRMLIKTIHLKEHLSKQEAESSQMQKYNSSLTQNLQEIRAIKHDIKNVFLTMGEFVAKSNDPDLKAYYQEKIVPFASQELKMNDVYMELQLLASEPLRGFFYYKMMQGIDRGVEIHLTTSPQTSFLTIEHNLTDITRILGIFIDNAIEEAAETAQKKVDLFAMEDNTQICFRVKNSVRDKMQERGIVSGTTTKGLGRGQGLTIAKKIVDKYDNILWNSYFSENNYVQSISIEKNR